MSAPPPGYGYPEGAPQAPANAQGAGYPAAPGGYGAPGPAQAGYAPAYPAPAAPAYYAPQQGAQGPAYPAAGPAYPAPAPYGAPPPAVMDYNLEALPGLVVKETTQVVDAVMASIGGAYEAANKYHVKAMPPGKNPGKDHDEFGAWRPKTAEIDSLPPVYYVEEDSSCCLRATLAYFGGLNLRALTLHYYVGNTDRYKVERPCKCGGCCCCPLEMTLYHKDQGMMGMVVEDFDNYCARCCQACCCCISKHKVMVGNTRASLVHKYSLVNAACCCGRVNNCCGATCCKPSFFIDIVEPDGSLAAVAQKTYGGGEGCSDCCRCVFDFNNYVLPFPPKATHAERVLLLTGLLSVEYAYHSRQGGEGNNNSGSSN